MNIFTNFSTLTKNLAFEFRNLKLEICPAYGWHISRSSGSKSAGESLDMRPQGANMTFSLHPALCVRVRFFLFLLDKGSNLSVEFHEL